MSRRLSLTCALLFAALLTSCFPRYNLSFLAFLALFPLLYGLFLSSSLKKAFRFSFYSGYFFIVFSLPWVGHVTWAGLIVFSLFESLIFGCFGVLSKLLLNRLSNKSTHRISFSSLLLIWITLPALWVMQEYARVQMPVIGFGFNLLGHSQSEVPILAQLARIFGAYGISYFVAMVNVTIFLAARNLIGWFRIRANVQMLPHVPNHKVAFLLCAVSLLTLGILTYGQQALAQAPTGSVMRIGVIQGNIPQPDKWDFTLKPLIIEKYKKLTLLSQYDGPDLLVWPEAAYPGYFNVEFEVSGFKDFVDELDIPLIVGAPHWETEDRAYNSAYLVEPRLGITDRYDKVNLVPFGEYIPFGSFFRLLGIEQYARAMGVSDFSFGQDPRNFFTLHGEHRFAALICFEDGFPDFCRLLVDHGSNFLLVITNDAWFEASAAPYQHLQCSIMRAIENGVYVVRSANTGVSAFINPKGIVEDRVKDAQGNDIFVTGGLTRPIFTSSTTTPYRKFGYLFPLFCCLFSIPVIFLRSSF